MSRVGWSGLALLCSVATGAHADNGYPLTVIYTTGQTAPASGGARFSSFEAPLISAHGSLAFSAELATGEQAVFLGLPGAIVPIVRGGTVPVAARPDIVIDERGIVALGLSSGVVHKDIAVVRARANGTDLVLTAERGGAVRVLDRVGEALGLSAGVASIEIMRGSEDGVPCIQGTAGSANPRPAVWRPGRVSRVHDDSFTHAGESFRAMSPRLLACSAVMSHDFVLVPETPAAAALVVDGALYNDAFGLSARPAPGCGTGVLVGGARTEANRGFSADRWDLDHLQCRERADVNDPGHSWSALRHSNVAASTDVVIRGSDDAGGGGDVAPGTALRFRTFEAPRTNTRGQFVFRATLVNGGAGVFGYDRATSTFRTIALTGSQPAGETSAYLELGAPVLDEEGHVAFLARLRETGRADRDAILRTSDSPAGFGEAQIVVQRGSKVGEATVRDLAFADTANNMGPTSGLGGQGVLVFRAAFDDGTQAIMTTLASVPPDEPEPGTGEPPPQLGACSAGGERGTWIGTLIALILITRRRRSPSR